MYLCQSRITAEAQSYPPGTEAVDFDSRPHPPMVFSRLLRLRYRWFHPPLLDYPTMYSISESSYALRNTLR
jgi:hypothetical protein